VFIDNELLIAYQFQRVEQPQLLWGVDCAECLLQRLLDDIITASGRDIGALVLNLSNMVVNSDATDEHMPEGEFVAVTIHGEGAWARDSRWGRGASVPAGILDAIHEAAQGAGAAGAYSRALGGCSSVTVLLPRA
jgi:hypothetical protein